MVIFASHVFLPQYLLRHSVLPVLPVEFQDDGLDLRGRHRGGGGHVFNAVANSGGVTVDGKVTSYMQEKCRRRSEEEISEFVVFVFQGTLSRAQICGFQE